MMEQLSRELRFEMSRAWRLKIPQMLLICYSLVTLCYMVTSGPWIAYVDNIPASMAWGFFPDPTYVDVDMIPLGANVLTICVAPLAHSLFFPMIALLVVGRLDGDRLFGKACQLSAGKGQEYAGILFIRGIVATIYVVGAFVLYSVAAAMAMMLCTPVQLSQIGEFAFRLLLCSSLCISFVIIASVAISLLGKGPFVLGTLLLANYLGFWIPHVVQAQMSWWMYICAPVYIDAYVVPTLQFSLASTLIAVAVAAVCLGVHRLRS